MATNAANLALLKGRRDAVIAELNALSASRAGGKPNVMGPGVNVDHQGYKKSLYDELRELNAQISRFGAGFTESYES